MLVRLHVLRGMLAGDVARSLPELQACPGNPRSTGALRLSSRDATREVLGTERLCLRRFTHADADFVLRLLNERTFIDNIGDRGVRTQDDARRYLEAGPFASYATYGFGLWLIESKLDGAPIGMCGFLQRDTLPNVDIGYALLPEFAGLGLAREAAMATLAGIPWLNAARLIHDAGQRGLAALCRAAGLPDQLYPAVAAALVVARETAHDAGEDDRERHARRSIERMVTQVELIPEFGNENLDYLLAKMQVLPPSPAA